MTSADVLRIVGLLERGVTALERVAAALEAANEADPLTTIAKAMASEENRPVNMDAQLQPPPDWMLR